MVGTDRAEYLTKKLSFIGAKHKKIHTHCNMGANNVSIKFQRCSLGNRERALPLQARSYRRRSYPAQR